MDEEQEEEKLLKKLRKRIPEANTTFHHAFGYEKAGWMVHGKFSVPISGKFDTRQQALLHALQNNK